MDCSIIYYSAVKTGLCEKALKKSFARTGLTLDRAVFVTKPQELGRELKTAFERSGLTFTVGGLDFGDSRNIADVLSCALSRRAPDECRRLECGRGEGGYLLRAGKQLLIMLPDDPERIEAVTGSVAADYINAVLS